ncbi:hypothetical protein MiSe_45630 [Microseira wollei NIES-4236]|uniref:Uncharacterized protein n=1 Tax=Microseira wollei NIES-4236 TaxID=2530354 RepID=A0AAV3XGE0_9CYAN|nr:hypothetical protein MiSe_45630 [Microseira wollei NIES-4236]
MIEGMVPNNRYDISNNTEVLLLSLRSGKRINQIMLSTP